MRPGERAVEQQRRQPVHGGPAGEDQRFGIARRCQSARLRLDDCGGERVERRGRRLGHGGLGVWSGELGPEHQLEASGGLEREPNVSEAARLEARPRIGRGRARGDHLLGQHAEALLDQRGEQAAPVLEVVVGGVVADPGLARHLAQAERADPRLVDERQAGLEQHGPEIAVVVRGSSCSSSLDLGRVHLGNVNFHVDSVQMAFILTASR